jgi:hypothetical protein
VVEGKAGAVTDEKKEDTPKPNPPDKGPPLVGATLIKLEACARAAHEVNRAYNIALGDFSVASWEEAPGWQKETILNGVRGVLEGNGPEQSHASWLAEKLEKGWRWGPKKDNEAKLHPCMVAWSELPKEQREKDHLFCSAVCCMAAALGITVIYPDGHAVDWSKEEHYVP